MKEKHIALIQRPNSLFFVQVGPTSSSANEIKGDIFKSFPSNTIHHLKVIGCDGTATNTGANGGIFTLIEKKLKSFCPCLLYTSPSPRD